MRSLKPLALILVIGMLSVLGCSSGNDDPSGPTVPDEPNDMSEALSDYWGAQEDVTESLLELNDILAEMETVAERGLRTQQQMDDMVELVDQYVLKSEAAGQEFSALHDLEESIIPYGERGMFTNFVGGVCKGIYKTAENAVVSSGQMMRTGWRVLSGSHTLRDALAAPDSGIPLVSGWAQDLQRTTQRRNDYIAHEISIGDTHDGNVPYDEIPGSTPQEKAANYLNLPEDDPIKRQAHRDFLLWSENGWEDCLTTLKDASKTGVKAYGEAVSGSGELVEVMDQLTEPEQDPGATAPVEIEIKNADDATQIAQPKTMIISKRNQPEDEPKIVVLEGVDPEFEMELPEGEYDIVTIADEFIRSAEIGLEVVTDQATGFVAELLEFAANSVVVEAVTVTPETGAVGQRVDCAASAASTIGSALSFDWSVDGPSVGSLHENGTACDFVPGEQGTYTITVTAEDEFSNSKSATTTLEVTPLELDVVSYAVSAEQVYDGLINPGETLTLDLDIQNGSDTDALGDLTLTGNSGVAVSSGTFPGLSIPGGSTVTRSINVQLPPDYSENTMTLDFEFAISGSESVIALALEFDVSFYVELNTVYSPVTEQPLYVSGKVANPAIGVAYLVIDGDYEQLFEAQVNTDGSFGLNILVEPSVEEVDHLLTLFADSGSWREEDSHEFSSQVPPAGFRVTLTWDTGGTDVDLWVTDPDGIKCYYANSSVPGSGLVLDTDNTSGYGPENISSQSPIPGAYFVQVHYFSDHDSEEAIGTTASIVIRENEGTEDETVRYYSGWLADSGDLWDVTTIEVSTRSMESGEPWNRVSYFDPELLPAK